MANSCLNHQEVDFYRENGFVIPRNFRLSSDELRRLRLAYDRQIKRNLEAPDFDPNFIIGPHFSAPGTMGIKGDPEWLSFAKNEDIIAMLGKLAGTGKAKPMHQDGDYYPIEPLETMSVWIALGDATQENGCMQYVRGSHKECRIFPHHWKESSNLTLTQVINPEYAPEDAIFDAVLKAGQVAIHDVYMVHGSRANTSPDRRAALVLRVMPSTSHYNHAKGLASDNPTHDYSKRLLYLISGRDVCGLNNFKLGH